MANSTYFFRETFPKYKLRTMIKNVTIVAHQLLFFNLIVTFITENLYRFSDMENIDLFLRLDHSS